MLKTLNLFVLSIIVFSSSHVLSQQPVTITIDAAGARRPVSPYIYGKNNSLSDAPGRPLSTTEWQRLSDLGIRMFRENGGNNSTKYNWRLKLSSHPDWYNNVYAHDWDYAARSLQEHIPSAQGMWAFQMSGKVAKTSTVNFNDWGYNRSQWWEGVGQNLCGGGKVNTAGGTDALVEGNPDLYLVDWPADSAAGILDHWFGNGGIGLDSTKIRYWNMDNEPEIWEGTHDDAWPEQPSAETFMQMYFEMAKKARAKFPGIKLVGPVTCNEWQWYNYSGSRVNYNGNAYVWLEYFILRIAEEQKLTGVRLLDVLDLHFYPGETNSGDLVQLHRVFFYTTYNYPGANGVRRLGAGGWDTKITKEYIFERCRYWLEKYIGPDHGVTFGVSEIGINGDNPNVTACWYASTLGEFARQGVELFTPWSWKTGMYEVLHLFSRYGKETYLAGSSSEEEFVSAYPTINTSGDTLTVFLVNRHLSQTKQVEININDFPLQKGDYKMLSLYSLPQTETFMSHQNNALKVTEIPVAKNKASIVLQPLSVNAAIFLRSTDPFSIYGDFVAAAEAEDGVFSGVSKSNSYPGYSGSGYVTGFDNDNDRVTVSMDIPETGLYKLLVRYIGRSGDKYQDVLVNNGFSSPVSFPGSDTFNIIDAGTYRFAKGINTFTVRKGWGWTDIDKFLVYTTKGNTYNISPSLGDTAATGAAKSLYDFLLMQFGDRMLSGQTNDYYGQVKNLTGKSPLIRVCDFQCFTEGYAYHWANGGHTFGKEDDGSVTAFISWYNNTGKKGIVSYQWHWHSPSGGSAGTNTFYTDQTSFDVTKAVTPGTQEYNGIIRDIDDIAIQLKRFQDAGVPVLFRPLHEAGGGWFWWGAKGPEACKQLYNIMYERMTTYHQLHNLIWVWSTPETAWYPGNDKVDIIGYDSYPGAYNYGNQKYWFDVLYKLTGGKKLIAMTENGPIPDPDNCLQQDAPWLYFMSWSSQVTSQNSEEHVKKVYSNPNVLTVESNNFKTSNEWRSSLYPENWKPGYKDSEGRFLHDFSYAGYGKGEREIPNINNNIVDVTLAPYYADNTGIADVTSLLQQALDDVGSAGGGVVYLPPGTYRIKTPEGSDYGLLIRYDSTVLRGAGQDSTFLFHDETFMRQKDIIHVRSDWSDWFTPSGSETAITADLMQPTRFLPVSSLTGFTKGDYVIVSSYPTDEWIAEHNMTGNWTADAISGVAFMRQVDSVVAGKKLLIVDIPIRYYLKTRDNAKVYHAGRHITGCGIENLSIGNREHPGTGWEEESYAASGTGAWDVHFSHVIHFKYSRDCWVRKVHTYKPETNTGDVHILSNGLMLDRCRNITVDSCFFQKPQYEGGGGNGYMFTLQSNDCLISNCRANHGRHNYDFKYPYSHGNVIHNCRAENSKYASDFHMFLSMANLFDVCTVDGDYLESAFRPYGGDTIIHGYTSTQSVFYNTSGLAYHPGKDYIIESKQQGWGYIIGTSGEAGQVLTTPADGSLNGFSFNTAPVDFTEGIGEGTDLRPWSLYLDQLYKRLNDTSLATGYSVNVLLMDEATREILPGARISIYSDTLISGDIGPVTYSNVPESFILGIEMERYYPVKPTQVVISSDTTLIYYLVRKEYKITFSLLEKDTYKVFWGDSIFLGSRNTVTGKTGEAVLTVWEGSYDYRINIPYFREESGILDVLSDTTFVFYLTRTHADAKLILKEGTSPVNKAMVVINGDTLISNSLGIANFKGLPVEDSYDFFIRKHGFFDTTGTFILTNDTTILISMRAWPTGIQFTDPESGLKCWPNPVHDLLHCIVRDDQQILSVNITDLKGTEVYRQDLVENSFTINVGNYPDDLYLLKVDSGDRQATWVFIKN